MSEQTDAYDEARRAAAAMYADDRASQSLGITVDVLAPGEVDARMLVTETMVNGHAIAHGGYIFLLADTAFAFACNTRAPAVAGAAEIVFVQPARAGDELIAEARERVQYGRSGIYDVTVRRRDGAVIAEFRGQSRQVRERGQV